LPWNQDNVPRVKRQTAVSVSSHNKNKNPAKLVYLVQSRHHLIEI